MVSVKRANLPYVEILYIILTGHFAGRFQYVMVVISTHELVYTFMNKLKAITIETYEKQHKNKKH